MDELDDQEQEKKVDYAFPEGGGYRPPGAEGWQARVESPSAGGQRPTASKIEASSAVPSQDANFNARTDIKSIMDKLRQEGKIPSQPDLPPRPTVSSAEQLRMLDEKRKAEAAQAPAAPPVIDADPNNITRTDIKSIMDKLRQEGKIPPQGK